MEFVASVIAVLQLMSKISSVCYGLYRSYGTRRDLDDVVDEVDALRRVLQPLERITKSSPEYSAMCSDALLLVPLTRCTEELRCLEADLAKIESARFPGRTISWMLKDTDIHRSLERLSRLKQTLQLFLETNHTSLLLDLRMQSVSIISSVEDAKTEQQYRLVAEWLGPAFGSSICENAQRARAAGTCSWFLAGTKFAAWKKDTCSSLWLHGTPGSGKTILCSAAIETLTVEYHNDPDKVVLHYFFEIAAREGNATNSFLCSLLSQVLLYEKTIHVAVQAMYTNSHQGAQRPSNKALLSALRAILKQRQHVALVIDGVDECNDRCDLLEVLKQIRDWSLPSLHLLVASRFERDIEDALSPVPQVRVVGQKHTQDIRQYVEQRVATEPSFKKWSTGKRTEISEHVVTKAGDMFRLAVLHLDDLQSCRNLRSLEQKLSVLPTTLDGTYAQMLKEVPSECATEVSRILRWVCFALRPPTLRELAEVVAIDTEMLEYDELQKYEDPGDVLGVCNNLLTCFADDGYVVKFAHASVRDYLTSRRLLESELSHFFLDPLESNATLCVACLTYLGTHNYSSRAEARLNYVEHSLINYTTSFWAEHLQRAGNDAAALKLASELLFDPNSKFVEWAWIGSFLPSGFYYELPTGDLDNPSVRANMLLYFATFTSNIELIDAALELGPNINGNVGDCGTCLIAAVRRADIATTKYLLGQGADVDHQVDSYEDALTTASYLGYDDMVVLLLSSGAKVNLPRRGRYPTSLVAAVWSPDRSIRTITLLLEAGADTSGQHELIHSPLNLAIAAKDNEVIRLLLNAGANADQGALSIALRYGDLSLASTLISQGATLHTKYGSYEAPIRAAVAHGVSAIEFLVKQSGVDLLAQDEEGRTALHFAASYGSEETITYLLQSGLNVNQKDKKGWTAVHFAASSYTSENLELLLPHWELDASGWNPLHLACRFNEPDALDLLLEAGLSPSTITTEYPARHWTLYDIAALHQNSKLLTTSGLILHEALETPDSDSNEEHLQLSFLGRHCDGCQNEGDPGALQMYGPVYHCSVCPNFDYCFICRATAELTHPHSSWEVIEELPVASSPEQTSRIMSKATEYSPLYLDPLHPSHWSRGT
ncbi:hypothetical protein C7974DRAFT_142520 [Boeremia exigua]|uniref:uncharacterized protein n=1 Tax=Boeremia exigua TaxID=749465 RepID=UPI001E8D3315|nr:uncharacterized protein C7974DRAFT_142520 [Boeremia exigua]KAH6637510.1 hypothetical protein C7974DRAFT_142520 [Boeremia exigua]